MKTRILGLIAVGLLAGPMVVHAGMIWGTNGHEYAVVTAEGITWTSASAAAQSSGWYLATIGSADENDFVKSLLNSGLASRSHFWIGATDQVSEGTFVWVDGTPFSFTDWWGGEPNNSGNEDYLAMDLHDGSWAWNDAPDNLGQIYGFARGYVMERVPNGTSVPEPGTLALLGLGLAGLGFSRRRKA
jgi:hypothetical protein